MRGLLLWCAQNPWLATHVPRWRFARRAVRRFLPGEGFEAALKAATEFRARGVASLFTLLGENVTDLADANKVVEHYEEVLAASAGPQPTPGPSCGSTWRAAPTPSAPSTSTRRSGRSTPTSAWPCRRTCTGR